MDFRQSIAFGLAWRTMILVLFGLVLAAILVTGKYFAPVIVAAIAVIAAIASLWRYIQQSNHEVIRFIEAIKHGDYGQKFDQFESKDSSLTLGLKLDVAMERLRTERSLLMEDGQFQRALVDSAPIAIVIVDNRKRVQLANTAARKLFKQDSLVKLSDFAVFGTDLVKALTETQPGMRRLATMTIDGIPQRAMLTASSVRRITGELKILAVQPIQNELNEAEVTAQTDLVRVLTHEIMNSITPVTSLARTAADLLTRVNQTRHPEINDAQIAVDTLAKRADGIMRFVDTYRKIARPPRLQRRIFRAKPWADDLVRLIQVDHSVEQLHIELNVDPVDIELDADPDLLAQVVLNLLRNSLEAIDDHPWMRFSIAYNEAGRTRIDIEDNGSGIAKTLQRDIFLPFFTTKKTGTGVGLSFAKQIVLAHGGSITAETNAKDGALFRIVL